MLAGGRTETNGFFLRIQHFKLCDVAFFKRFSHGFAKRTYLSVEYVGYSERRGVQLVPRTHAGNKIDAIFKTAHGQARFWRLRCPPRPRRSHIPPD